MVKQLLTNPRIQLFSRMFFLGVLFNLHRMALLHSDFIFICDVKLVPHSLVCSVDGSCK